jgi:hypothetical protein
MMGGGWGNAKVPLSLSIEERHATFLIQQCVQQPSFESKDFIDISLFC